MAGAIHAEDVTARDSYWSAGKATFRRLELTLLLNPPDDPDFAMATRAAVGAGTKTPEQLQQLLRGTYRAAVVRAREIADESFTVWYVYRDGHWTASRPAREVVTGG